MPLFNPVLDLFFRLIKFVRLALRFHFAHDLLEHLHCFEAALALEPFDVQLHAAVRPDGDVKFSLMRNTINAKGDDISGSDVADYLERAAELNDEVDTVAFGLETSDNEIVKVYVNAQQADDFEAEMQNLLGVEDDIENAINTLAQKFDIVDVVWPETNEVEDEDQDEAFDILADEFGDDDFDDLTMMAAEPEDADDDSAYDKI
jgi:hypothetical protein